MRKRFHPAVRRNPEKASWDGFVEAVRRVFVLARTFAKVVDRHENLEVPAIMAGGAQLLAWSTRVAKAYLQASVSSELSTKDRQFLESCFEAARSVHKRSSELRKSEEWIVWSALKPIPGAAWRKASEHGVFLVRHADEAVRQAFNEEWSDAMVETLIATEHAGNVLLSLGYMSAGQDILDWSIKMLSVVT